MNTAVPVISIRDLKGSTDLGPVGDTVPLTLDLMPGECGVIMGGKWTSSFFRLLMGLGKIQSGEIIFGDNSRMDTSARGKALATYRNRIGFAFRDKGLISNLTLFDNVDLPAKYHGFYRQGATPGQFAREALTDAGVDESCWSDRPFRISWEIRKKVLLARAAVLKPPLLILDDPSAMLATVQLPDVVAWIRKQQERGMAVMTGTNDLPFAVATADWILHPRSGRPVREYGDFIEPCWRESGAILRARCQQP